MTTPLEIIQLSMKDAGLLGVGETPQAEDVNDAFMKLNWMISEWSQQKWLVYHLVTKEIPATGSRTYSIGPGEEIDFGSRPAKLYNAIYRQQPAGGTPVDYPMTVIAAREDYELIAAKFVTGPPRAAFLDTGWPNGTIYIWPIPQAGQYTLIFTFMMELTGFSSLTETISLPPIYESAMNWNLAMRLTPMSGDDKINAIVMAEAKKTLALIRNTNAQVRRLRMPAGLPRRGYFDPITGLWY